MADCHVTEAEHIAALCERHGIASGISAGTGSGTELGISSGIAGVTCLTPPDLEHACQTGVIRCILPNGHIGFLIAFDPADQGMIERGAYQALHDYLCFVSRKDFNALLLRDLRVPIAAWISDGPPSDGQGHSQIPVGARVRFSAGQSAFWAATAIVLAFWWFLFPNDAGHGQMAALCLLFVLPAALQGAALIASARLGKPIPAISDAHLPQYTVLVALYGEESIIPTLVQRLCDLDYPAEKLDVLFLLEAHDTASQTTFGMLRLPPWMRVVIVPPGAPRTKPRALNLGLLLARGTLLTVFDAEDKPDKDQLRKAAAAFAQASPQTACLQAELAIDNADDSWITRFFAVEYASLFGVIKHGAAKLGLPVPLGGTSNHFKTQILRHIGGWDAFNVTEDADLGLRLYRLGYQVGTLESCTWEEAPTTLPRWMRQRRRWLKGWLQTALVQTRRMGRAQPASSRIRHINAGFVAFAMALSPIFYPWGLWLLLKRLWMFVAAETSDPDWWLLFPALAFLLTIATATMACWRAKIMRFIPLALLMPVYGLLIWVASLISIIDFIRDPHVWLKTAHGLGRTSRSVAVEHESKN